MKKFTIKSLLIIALAIIPMTIFAQEEQTPTNNWFIGIEGGATQFFGDNTAFKMDQTSWDAGLFFGYTFKNSIYLYANVGYVDLKGKNDGFYKINNLNLIQGNINLGYDVLQLIKLNPHRLVGIVPHVGYGVMMHKSEVEFNDGTIVKNGYSNSNNGGGLDGRRTVFQIPVGVNFVFNFTKHFQANIDVVATKTDTEGMDCVQRGKHTDWYSYANLGLAYKFGARDAKKCPVCPEVEPAAPDCDACADAIRQAVKDAVDEAMKNHPCEEAQPARSEAANTEAVEAVPFKNIDLDLTFKTGSAKIEDSEANRNEIKEISDDIEAGMQFSTIKVEGYASPEGNDKQNQQLSQDRADATVAYIQKNLGDQVKDVEFQAKGNGSDWDGFYTALRNSNITDKAEIEKSIKEAENPTAKLNQLRNQYPALESLLKSLRRTQVSYIE